MRLTQSLKVEIEDENENVILLGDFNGHVGFLGTQDININGR